MDVTMIPIFGMLTGVLINIAMFTTIILAVYYNTKARNKERMALIEKGVDVSEIYRKKENPHTFYKLGFVLIGIAVGLIFSVIVSKLGLLPSVVAYFSMILLFGGVAMLLANYLLKEKQDKLNG